jgi:basic amino acid/polyamine antiporter, APA family
LITACSVVVANMIGTGVFTSLGFQLQTAQNLWSIMILWLGGGIIALCGALSYAELGAHFKATGGDYIFLSRVFHPLAGYLSAWAGLTIGFSAPIALAAIAFIKYMAPVVALEPWIAKLIAVGIIVLITLLHSFTLRHSSRLQNLSTILKIGFLLTLIIAGSLFAAHAPASIITSNSWQQEITTTGFAVSMIFVTYAYTGWNAAAYIAGEMKDPQKNVPKALIFSTLVIIILYTAFQWVLLRHAPIAAMQGKEEVSYISFQHLWGDAGAKWVSFFIALQLIATMSSYLWVGPRVTWAMSSAHHHWKPLSKQNQHGIPVRALWLHAFISIILTLSGSFEQILVYAGFILQLFSALNVSTSLFIKPEPGAFKTPLKPLPQILFLLFSVWVLVFTAIDKPMESLIGIGIVLSGILLAKIRS